MSLHMSFQHERNMSRKLSQLSQLISSHARSSGDAPAAPAGAGLLLREL